MLGVQSRQLVAESSLLLPCDVGNSVSPEQAQWFRDGVPLSRDDLRGVRNYCTLQFHIWKVSNVDILEHPTIMSVLINRVSSIM